MKKKLNDLQSKLLRNYENYNPDKKYQTADKKTKAKGGARKRVEELMDERAFQYETRLI